MKNQFKCLSIVALSMVSVLLLASCDPKGTGRSQSGQGILDPARAPDSSSAPTTANGTSHSGGGTGVANKVFESYIVDPTALASYLQYVKPLLGNLKSENLESDNGGFETIIRLKTWYVAPVELDKIGKDLLGVSFMKSDTQQIARQTLNEVWINKTIFDSMDSQAKGELILHEIVMSIYLFKFIPMSKMCYGKNSNGEQEKAAGCGEVGKALDISMPAEVERPLDDQDNANIRFVTGWMIQNAQHPVSNKEFMTVLYAHGFDRRLFNPARLENSQKPRELKVSGREFFNAINGATLTGKMPNLCVSQNSANQKPCGVNIIETKILVQGGIADGFKLTISIAGEAPIEITFFAWSDIVLYSMDSIDGGPNYSFSLSDWHNEVKIGDRQHSGVILFKQETFISASVLTVDSFVIVPGVVTSIDPNREVICLASAPTVKELRDDGIIIKRSTDPTYPSMRLFALMKPSAFCTKENVQRNP